MTVLCLDVGMGTNDLLVWDPAARGENQVQLVVPSTTRVVAGEISGATRRGLGVVFRGVLMGGGPSTGAMRRHVEAGLPFYAEPAAARTFSDDLEEVAAMGVRIVSEDEAARLTESDRVVEVLAGDLRLPALLASLELLGAPAPTGLAVAVQDHGSAPAGMSDRLFRFRLLRAALERSDRLRDLFHPADEVPASLTRMEAVAGSAAGRLPLVVGDTGPAALWGAALAFEGERVLAINYGNGHTLMSLVEDGRVDGLFEHHTGQLDEETMTTYVRRFATGELRGEEVFEDGGHGALPVSDPFDLEETPVAVTGPNRTRFRGAGFPQTPASLHGAMMTIGCWGLLEAFRALNGDG